MFIWRGTSTIHKAIRKYLIWFFYIYCGGELMLELHSSFLALNHKIICQIYTNFDFALFWKRGDFEPLFSQQVNQWHLTFEFSCWIFISICKISDLSTQQETARDICYRITNIICKDWFSIGYTVCHLNRWHTSDGQLNLTWFTHLKMIQFSKQLSNVPIQNSESRY